MVSHLINTSNELGDIDHAEALLAERIRELDYEDTNPNGVDPLTAKARLTRWLRSFKESTIPNTYRAYMAALVRFENACVHLGVTPVPITPSNMCKVVDYLVNAKKCKLSTLRITCTMVNTVHDACGFYKPTLNKQVQLKLKFLRSKAETVPRQSVPMEYSMVLQVVEEYLRDGSPRCIRDACLASVMFDGLLRRSEAMAIKLHHVSERSAPLGKDDVLDEKQLLPFIGYRETEKLEGSLFIPRSKSDQEGKGAFVYLSPLSTRLISYMIEQLDLYDGDGEAYLFRGIEKSGRVTEFLSDQGIYRALKRMSAVVGVPVNFSGHSCRVGACIELGRQSIPTHMIQQAGRWASPAMPAYYTRNESVYMSAMAKFHRHYETFEVR